MCMSDMWLFRLELSDPQLWLVRTMASPPMCDIKTRAVAAPFSFLQQRSPLHQCSLVFNNSKLREITCVLAILSWQ